MVRRVLDNASHLAEGRILMVALDWAKAFDTVDPDALIVALRRFGLPEQMLAAVRAIYSRRRFAVREAGCASDQREQKAGICQGCPLSPLCSPSS